MQVQLRKCKFSIVSNEPNDERVFSNLEGLFHGWGTRYRDSEDGQQVASYSVGIVEDKTGQVHTVLPNRISFTEGVVQ